MKKLSTSILIISLATFLSSCSAIESIFKAGMWTGILIVIVVIALIIWIGAKIIGGGRD